MADISKIKVDDVEYDIKDAVARESIAGLQGITYVESSTENMVNVRDLESGTYVFLGKFKPFSGSTSTLSFSSRLLVNIIRGSSYTSMMVFYPVNNCVQYMKITDTANEKKYVYLNDLMDTVDALETSVGDLTALTTTEQTSLVGAVNEVNASIGDIGTILDAINGEVI